MHEQVAEKKSQSPTPLHPLGQQLPVCPKGDQKKTKTNINNKRKERGRKDGTCVDGFAEQAGTRRLKIDQGCQTSPLTRARRTSLPPKERSSGKATVTKTSARSPLKTKEAAKSTDYKKSHENATANSYLANRPARRPTQHCPLRFQASTGRSEPQRAVDTYTASALRCIQVLSTSY